MAVALWLMVGGAILAGFGVIAAVFARSADDRGGLSKPLALVGTTLFLFGFYLDDRWGSPW